ncbi:hypothetical protein CC1G_02578 [Coprinopsis cinerea okayama7|uniref:Uncharacterized protein n=1 Tax=Coprinopsis cinerea (strain Okayama-7 / 130 / ATCC MYA-4618 / FGSC 9003) TaxID=240176 RepID=A8PB76_COPC7|nr:hypothetical protein CC1G_02578 [Coprinopsis cinerea okayama7\|eukprot:XP_001840115.1 hypothetical protein CC1G_02578 [Coprinopsis cinerea okayama7\
MQLFSKAGLVNFLVVSLGLARLAAASSPESLVERDLDAAELEARSGASFEEGLGLRSVYDFEDDIGLRSVYNFEDIEQRIDGILEDIALREPDVELDAREPGHHSHDHHHHHNRRLHDHSHSSRHAHSRTNRHRKPKSKSQSTADHEAYLTDPHYNPRLHRPPPLKFHPIKCKAVTKLIHTYHNVNRAYRIWGERYRVARRLVRTGRLSDGRVVDERVRRRVERLMGSIREKMEQRKRYMKKLVWALLMQGRPIR